MSDADSDPTLGTNRKSKMPLILGLVLALAGGGGGFFAVSSGLLFGAPSDVQSKGSKEDMPKGPDVAYVAIDPLVISLRTSARAGHLKFRAHLEVPSDAKAEVELVLPRVVDVLNTYLRALDPGDLEDPAALTRLRAQMLRRVQVVTGMENVNDLLIMEFVLT